MGGADASLYTRTDRRHPASGWTGPPAGRAEWRGSGSGSAADRVPLSSTVSVCVRPLPCRRTATDRDGRWTQCVVLVAHTYCQRCRAHPRGCRMSATAAGAGRLSSEAYEQVRSQIVHHQLPPGTVLSEAALAASLGMSKTPIRHALLALQQEGLLELGPRRQLLVCGLPGARRHELREVREALEGLAITHACRDISEDDLDHLRTLLRRQRRAAEADREDEFIDLDEELHLTLASCTGLDLVPRLLRQLGGFVRLMQRNTG